MSYPHFDRYKNEFLNGSWSRSIFAIPNFNKKSNGYMSKVQVICVQKALKFEALHRIFRYVSILTIVTYPIFIPIFYFSNLYLFFYIPIFSLFKHFFNYFLNLYLFIYIPIFFLFKHFFNFQTYIFKTSIHFSKRLFIFHTIIQKTITTNNDSENNEN